MFYTQIKKAGLHFYNQIRQNDVSAVGAQLSYYMILSFFPFLIFLITLLKFTPLTHDHTLHELSLILPDEAFSVVSELISEIANSNNATILSIGMLGTLWASSKGTSALIRGINRAYDAKDTRPFWKIKIIGIIFTIALAFLILFSLSLLVFGQVLGQLIFNRLGISTLFYYIWTLLRYLIPLISLFTTFILLYIFAPDISLKFKDVYCGAIFSTFGWIIVSLIFSFYVNNFGNYTKTYGSIGGVIVLLIWLYISSVIVLLGGELNATIYSIFYKPPKHITSKNY